MTPVWIALPLTLALALTGCGLQNYSTDGASPQACTALAAAQPAVSQIVNKANEVTVGDVRAHLLEVSAQLGQATSHSSGSAQCTPHRLTGRFRRESHLDPRHLQRRAGSTALFLAGGGNPPMSARPHVVTNGANCRSVLRREQRWRGFRRPREQRPVQ